MKAENITGQRFGRLVAIERDFSRKDRTFWLCKCDCGNIKSVATISLKKGLTNSCGCLHKELMSKRLLNDLIGQRFGYLTVIERVYVNDKDTFWLCKCDCGNYTKVNASKLVGNRTKSCGCMRNTMISNALQGKSTFSEKSIADSHTRLYRIYKKIIRRCCVKDDKAYPSYGGRGISVCDEWKNDFKAFKQWSYDNGYDDSLSIDRIDNDGNYEPSNCRWADKTTQANNRRSNRYMTYKGKTQTIAEWSRETGINVATLYYRIKNGWTEQQCIETPVRKI